MPIRFKCPHCKKPLSVKDHLAGKKGACPACKKPITIPAPVAAAADLEEFAARSLADEPAPATAAAKADGAPAAPAGTIDFTCPFCDAELHLPAEQGGKQAPCPECKHILKIPKLIADRAKDWREVQSSGPSAALANQPKELEGAWGTATSKSKVSREALEEADAIVDEDEEPVGVGRWIKRGALAVVLIGVAVFGYTTWSDSRRESRNLADINKAVEHMEKAKLPTLWAAEVHRGAGEFFLRAKNVDMARKHLLSAFTAIPDTRKSAAEHIDADACLIDLALTLIDLGGTAEQAENKERIEWKELSADLRRVIEKIQSPDARLVAIQEVGGKLLRTGMNGVALDVANALRGAGDTGPPSLATSGLVAMLLALDNDKEAASLLPNPKETMDPLARIGYAEGYSRKKKYDEARAILQTKPVQPDCWHAAVAAAVAAGQSADPAAAKQFVEEALKEWKTVRHKRPHPFLVFQFVRVAARVDPSGIKELLKSTGPVEKHLKARAMLEWLLVHLEQSTTPVDFSLADEIGDKESPAFAVACAAIGRHKAKLGYRSEVLATAPPDERIRAFLHFAAALGDQDRR